MADTTPNPESAPGPDSGSPETVGRAAPAAATAGPAAAAAAPSSISGPEDRAAAEPPERTWTVLIAALGGEGGGVLSSWLVDAASADGRRVQATSVPGVAQRTGATTYYLEIGLRHGRGDGESGGGGGSAPGDGAVLAFDGPADGGARTGTASPDDSPQRGSASTPDSVATSTSTSTTGSSSGSSSGSGGEVMALLPTPGNVDLLVASELLEAGRAAQNGMITPDRTTVIASTHRMFAIAEKSAMGDGRFNDERVRRAVRELSRRHVLTDLGKVAEQAGTVLSSVLLGAVAGSGALPIPRERLRAAIERAGIAVEANQRGFDAGFRLFDDDDAPAGPDARSDADLDSDRAVPGVEPEAASDRLPGSLAARVEALLDPVREFARMGVERTVDYQDARYGALYLDRIERLLAGTVPAAASPEDGLAAVRETARQLALWMCFEDIIRVADLKTRRGANRAGAGRGTGQARPAGRHHRVPEAGGGRVVLGPSGLARAAHPACGGPGRLAPPAERRAARAHQLRNRVSPVVDPRPAQGSAARHAPISRGAGADRDLARTGRRSTRDESRPRPRGGEVREPRQGLRRHPRAGGAELRANDGLPRRLRGCPRPRGEPSHAPGGSARRSRRGQARRRDSRA